MENRVSRERCGERQGREGGRGIRQTNLCVVIDGASGDHVAGGEVLESAVVIVQAGEGVDAPRKDICLYGVVDLLCVVYDGDECVLHVLLSVVMMGGECGAKTVDEGCAVDGASLIIAVYVSAVLSAETVECTRRGGRSRMRARPSRRRALSYKTGGNSISALNILIAIVCCGPGLVFVPDQFLLLLLVVRFFSVHTHNERSSTQTVHV